MPESFPLTQESGPPTSKFVLGVDLDGVVADFYKAIRPLAAEWMNVDESTLSIKTDYAFKAWGFPEGEYLKLHRYAVTQRDLFKNMEAIPGAAPALRRLSRLGIYIRIITYRLFIDHFHQPAASQTVAWLDYHAIPYWDLCFIADKTALEADLYIDDSPSNIVSLRKAGKDLIAFASPANDYLFLPLGPGQQLD